MLSLVYWTNHGLGLVALNSTALADAWLGSLARDLPGWLCSAPGWWVGGAGHASPKPGHLASESTSLTHTNHLALSTAPDKVHSSTQGVVSIFETCTKTESFDYFRHFLSSVDQNIDSQLFQIAA